MWKSEGRPRRVLLLVTGEFSQANVHLSTAHALLQLDPNVEVHFGSFKEIRDDVQATSDYALKSCPEGRKPIVFHELHALGYKPAVMRHMNDVYGYFTTPPTFRRLPHVFSQLPLLMCPWDAQETVSFYQETERILQEVQPDVVAVDNFLVPALTACRHLGVKFSILTPNSFKEFSSSPELFYKLPCIGSNIPFPIPWHLLPLQFWYMFQVVKLLTGDKTLNHTKSHVQHILGTELTTPMDLATKPPRNFKIIMPSTKEIDYPVNQIPDHYVTCGPIVRASPPLIEADPKMQAWLSQAPTIYMNGGTHLYLTEDNAVEMAKALRSLFNAIDAAPPAEKARLQGLQVLWKVKMYEVIFEMEEPGCRVHDILGKEIDEKRVRITTWIDAEPMSLLNSGHVVLAVTHGGANSYMEAISCGIPQVILPPWLDCFDFANRVEYHGLGVCGNRNAAPDFEHNELAAQLTRVLIGKEAESIRGRVREMAELFRTRESGSIVAAKTLMAQAEEQV